MSQFQAGDQVREIAGEGVKNQMGPFFGLVGLNADDIPDQLEGVVLDVSTNEDGEEVVNVKYSNAPEWGPETAHYYATMLELAQ